MPLVAEEVSFENKKIFQETCEKCEGHKVLSKKKELKLVIEKGMKDKDEIIFTGESDEHPFKIPGDLHVILRQNKHSFFYLRKGNDLYAEVQLNFKQAILGFNKSFRHFDNKELRFSKKKVTQPNEMKAIKGQGMPVRNSEIKRGDLHLKFKISLPESLTEEEKMLINSLL